MKRQMKRVLALMGVGLLLCSGRMTVQAAPAVVPISAPVETVAPFSAEQLLAVVNAQCLNVNSLHQVVAETVQMTDARKGLTITANVSLDERTSRTTSYSVTAVNMTFGGFSQSTVEETWSAVSNGVLVSLSKEPAEAVWHLRNKALTPAEAAQLTSPLALNGIDTTGSVVTTNGLTFKFAGNLDAAHMAELMQILNGAGLRVTSAAFPVTVEVDAATLLPKSMTIAINGLAADDMPGVTASATAVITYSEFNLYDALTVPQEVLTNCAVY